MVYSNLIIGDCLEKLKDINDSSIDLIITSPPYNLGNLHHTGSIKHNPYEDNFPENEYQEWQINVLQECFRVLKYNGSLIYNHKNRIKKGVQITPYQWLLRTDFIVKQEIVWINGSQNFDKIRFYPMTERIYWLAKDSNTKLFNAINHHDVFGKEDWESIGIKGIHTRTFPEGMVCGFLKCFPNATVVLDPFMGIGTTGVVCRKMNRNFIGIELNPEYVRVADSRINNTVDCSNNSVNQLMLDFV